VVKNHTKCIILLFIYFAVLDFELRAYTVSYSTYLFWCEGFFFQDRVS
jgi:hypothetical protein